jgi:mRNA-degrading endonuclease toxin of MazEF toxin-antitoxin module
MICTTAPQQGRMAAGARSCSVLGGYLWNASVGMTMDSVATTEHVDFATKRRPARHLGAPPS